MLSVQNLAERRESFEERKMQQKETTLTAYSNLENGSDFGRNTATQKNGNKTSHGKAVQQ